MDASGSVPLRSLNGPHDLASPTSPFHSRSESPGPSHRIPQWKQDLHALLEQPTSSPAAFLIHVASTALIIFSAILTILETLPFLHSTAHNVWFGLETGIVVLFTAEYLARGLAWSADLSVFCKWFFSFFGIIDLLGIFPYYIELAFHADTTAFFRFSILRTFRLLRVFRPFRHSNTILLTIEVMYLSFMRSKDALLALGFFVVMALVVFSTLLYFAERGTWDDTLETFINSDGDPSQFASIPAAAWFVLVTMTTVGYGDLTPRSLLGRFITLPLLLFGLLLIALPSFVLGREFSIVWGKMEGRAGRGDRWGEREDQYDPQTSTRAFFGESHPSPHQSHTSPADLQHLTRQIDGLRRVVEKQSQILEVLTKRFDGKTRSTSSSARATSYL